MKRTSITRLKPYDASLLKSVTQAWNEKNLDYEIETKPTLHGRNGCNKLEMKRTSITRLKLDNDNRSDYATGLEMKRTSITRLKRVENLTVRIR